MLDAKVDEVSIDEDVVRWSELGVMLEEHTHFLLLHVFDIDVVNFRELVISGRVVFTTLVFLNLLAPVVHLQASVIRVNHSLNLSELSSLVCFSHLLIINKINIILWVKY